MKEELSSSNGLQERFDAAVRVIRTLPANGSFQPSREMLLRFYALYKQAMEGPCINPKPPFYDVTNRAKWEAYKSVEAVSKEAAMEEYVGELKKIIEMMSLTPEVSEFLDKLGSFYELVNDDPKSSSSNKFDDSTGAKSQIFNGNSSEAIKAALNVVARSSHSESHTTQFLQIKPTLSSSSSDSEEGDSKYSEVLDEIQNFSGLNGTRRDSIDSFKSQPESHVGDLDNPNRKENNGIFQTLFPELEEMKKRIGDLEDHCRDQAKRLRAAECNIELLARESSVEKSRGRDLTASSENPNFNSQNRLLILLHRFWSSLESRVRRYPLISAFIAIFWPIFMQVVSFVLRKSSRRRPR